MRRIASAVLASTAALLIGLFTASVAGAQAPAATISVTGSETTWSPDAVTVTTGETVRWSFEGSALPHNVHGTGSNWNPPLQSPVGTGQQPVDYTFTAPGLYTFVCDVHPTTMSGTVTVEDPGADPLENVLVFSETAGFRHDSIPQGIAAIEALGAANDFEVDATEDSAQFTTSNLAQYDAVVFLSTTGDVLTDEQQDAFESYMRSGGGFVGIHAAADTEYTWPWYGEMIGGYFRNHPPGTPTATVNINDPDEPSTAGLPASWVRTDEWYNYQSFETPSVGGGGDDYNVAESGVKVLASVDESTYVEQDGSDGTNDPHPIAWCSDFDGGHVWYTGMGHTSDSFGTAAGNIRSHILGGLQTVTGAEESDCGEPRQATPSVADFEKITLDDDTENPFELDIAPDGRVFYIERNGEVNIWKPDTEQTVVAGSIPVYTGEENGLMGLQLAPDFEESGYIYLTYSALPESTNQQRVSRFQVEGDELVPGSERVILTWQHQRDECCHSSGALDFGPDGSLYISAGDNTNPFASDGFTPIDERPDRQAWDAQRTSANTNDLNGKFMRILPMENIAPGTTPGIGTTYTIPAGNLFPTGTALTRPEIFAMGFRNPFRFTVDPETGWVLMGDYGPDAGATVAGRGPQGSVEFNAITSAGNYGWPYCIRQNVAYNDYTFPSGPSGPLFNCAAPANNSPNNTGLTNLPPARPATMWMGYTEVDSRFPGLGTGGAPMGGPRYHFDPDNPSVTKFPEYYDGEWFIGEWNNGWIKHATLDGQGNATDVRLFPYLGAPGCVPNAGQNGCYKRPMDMDFGPDGSLYLIEWGSGFGGNNADSGIYRIDYVGAGRRPIAHASADPTSGQAPLEVDFSADGSIDPDGTSLTYEWNFGDGSPTADVPNPTHVYGAPGTYTATLRVTDQSGATGVDSVQIVVGNTAPVVTITIPENGQFAEFGDEVPYEITVTDAEDGTTEDGSIDCQDVTLNVYLGHDQHAHELSEHQGCEGTFETLNASGHGESADTFTTIEAVYTDEAQPGGAIALTGRDEAILPRKRQQAEFFDTTGRAPGATGGGDPGVQTETTGDTGGGGLNIGFIENGDYVSYEPMNLKDITSLRFRVASAGAGGTIEVRTGAPDGPLVATTEFITPTGGWQLYKTVELALTNPPAGTHELFFVFRHPTDQGGLMNVNWIQFVGKGAATTAAPEVTATADPATGTAPLQVQFDAEGTDAEGGALTYAWDFGVAGTNNDTSTEEDPTYTYQQPGTYTARVTVTDPEGAEGTAAVEVRVTSSDQCPTGPVRSDEFDGDALDTSRWTIIRPDATRPPTVSGGNLNFPIDNGSIYGPGTSARNIVVQPLPEGDVQVTAKITTDPLVENYQQAGLRVYADDNNWASVHMIHAGGSRDFEFIWESNGNPRNEGADKLGGIPADSPHAYWVRLVSDGEQLTAFYSFDGVDFLPVGRPGSLATFQNPQIGPVALSDQAPSYPVARFDWIRFNPDGTTGGGGGGGGIVDNFDGTALGSAWEVVRQNQDLTVSGGTLNIPAAQGDIYGGRNDAANLVTRDLPGGDWVATAKLNFEGTAQYHQAGIMVYLDDQNFTKFGRIAHTTAGDEKFEFIYENAGTPRNEAADSTANIAADFPDDFYVRISKTGDSITGSYSTNGNAWTPVGRAAPLPANAKIGLFAFSNAAATAPVAAFDSFTLTGDEVGGGGGGEFSDAFDGAALDKDRWNAIVRDVPAEYTVEGGELTIATSPGDIYTGDTNPPPNNFILQDASHAGADWTIETKLSGTISGGYGQGGLMAYLNGDNYVKLDPISDAGSSRINRIELRSEVGGVIQNPQPNVEVPVGTTDYWIRLSKSGTTYSGEYSFDGTNWTEIAQTVANPMASPDFGIFAFDPQPDGQGDTVSFDYFLLNGEQPQEPCVCEGFGDDFEAGTLNRTRWNNIIREQESLYNIQNGTLNVTTVNGDIYTGGDPAPTRNFFLQTADHAGQDWVIETHIDAATISGGYEQAGLMAYVDDQNYVKYDVISDDGQTVLNRIELRSEVGGAIQNPQPQLTPLPAGTTEVRLRLTKAGTNYSGEYSFDGTNWTSIGQPVPNAMADPSFGLFTLGVNSGGGTARFGYFSLDGDATGCPPPEPENRAPVIAEVAASPQTGFAPLEVDFSVTASDPDAGDTLTYAWDFDGDGDTDSTEEDPTHTYTEEGDYEAEVTVSDGEAERSRTIPVSVFGETDPEARFRVLVFSKTAGFRHDSIDEGHAAIEQLGAENDFQVDHTEDATIFNDAALANYDSVIWLSTTGDVLNAAQQAAFERYVRGGGGFTGIHAAADTEYDWKWYGNLVGGYFLSHPPGTPNADVIVEDADDHTTDHLDGPVWNRDDEWYNYRPVNFEETGNVDYSPRAGGVHVLLTVDESTYDEQDGNATDDDHPISWCKRYDGGRSWYTGMGHTAASFSEDDYLQHILGGIEVSAGAAASEECGAQDPDAPIVEAFGDPTSGTAPLEVQFTSTAIDPNGPRLPDTAFRWTFGDGSSRFGRSVEHVYGRVGVYTATLTVTDAEGKKSTDTVQITVNPRGNVLPTVEAAADPASGDPPLTVNFEAVGIDPDGPEDRITYEWDFGDGTGGQFGRVVSHTYRSAGEYTAEVTATDERGGSATATIEITVEDPPGNQAPTVRALADPMSGPAPLRVRLSSNPADVEDGDNLLVVWDFGDGRRGGGEAVFHTYPMPGTYTAKVTVTDTDGATASDTVTITVTAPVRGGQDVASAPPPPAGDVESETESETRPSVRLTRRHKLARVVKRGLRYTVACETACRVTSTLRIAGADNQRLGKAAARRIAAGDSRRFVLRLDRTVRRNLASAMRKAKLRNLRATLVLKIKTADGTATVRRAVVLRR